MKSSAICSNRGILVVVVQCLLALIPSSLTEGNENILTQSELRAKYGQGTYKSSKGNRANKYMPVGLTVIKN